MISFRISGTLTDMHGEGHKLFLNVGLIYIGYLNLGA
jgi:hypothetical protein